MSRWGRGGSGRWVGATHLLQRPREVHAYEPCPVTYTVTPLTSLLPASLRGSLGTVVGKEAQSGSILRRQCTKLERRFTPEDGKTGMFVSRNH